MASSPLHVALQFSSSSKLFAFPPHPPYVNSSHFPVSGLYLHLKMDALQTPMALGSLQIARGLSISPVGKIAKNVKAYVNGKELFKLTR